MAHKRVIRIVSIEGNSDFVDSLLANREPQVGYTKFYPKATVKELERIEIAEGSSMGWGHIKALARAAIVFKDDWRACTHDHERLAAGERLVCKVEKRIAE